MAEDFPVLDLKAAFTDHDRLFKELLTVFLLDFIDLFLPEVAGYLDGGSVAFRGTELFANVSTGEKHIVDILAQARFRNHEAFFLLHVENPSKMQAVFPEPMFHYYAELSRTQRLPVYRVIQLNRLNWRDFVNRPNPVAAALLAKMKIAPKDRPRVKLECLRMLANLKLDPARTQLLSGFVDSYLKLNALERLEFEREMAALPPDEREATMPLTISWKEEGRVEGLADGERQVLLRIGGQRLGPPSPRTVATLAAITSSERLIGLADRLLKVESWDELLLGQ